jgi:transposase
MLYMPGLVWKNINGDKRLVLRWKKRINGKLKTTREIYIGDMDRLADMITNPMKDAHVIALDFGTTAFVRMVEQRIGLKDIVDKVMVHKGDGMSPGDYVLLFIMNRLSDPVSKNAIERWMVNDYASTIYRKRGSQDFWNLMDRFTDGDIKTIMDSIRDKVSALGYDFTNMFVDASNMYTFMEENDMARKGHNKKHRYDLNQISYYIAANYDYIPLYGESYAGNVHDSRTFESIISNMPENSTLIFDRGYNSKSNIDLISGRRYIGALKQSDHHGIMKLKVERDSHIELTKNVYGRDHRIILYHSSSLERRRREKFMKRMERVILKAKKIMESGDSDSMEKARIYLETEKLNETILLPSVETDQNRMDERLSMMGKNAIFTNIMDMDAESIIDLYKKRNRVEHCFRTINTMGIAFPVYHWTPQKIRVHMFFSLLAYLFLALIRMTVKPVMDLYLTTVQEVISTIRIVYITRGKSVDVKLSSGDERALRIMEKFDLVKMI